MPIKDAQLLAASSWVAAIQTIKTKLPFLVGLAEDARRELARLGTKTVGFDMYCTAAMANG